MTNSHWFFKVCKQTSEQYVDHLGLHSFTSSGEGIPGRERLQVQPGIKLDHVYKKTKVKSEENQGNLEQF